MKRFSLRLMAVLAASLTIASPVVAAAGPGRAAAAPSGVPGLGPQWTSLIHGDLASSDSTAFPGPGRGGGLVAAAAPGGPCAATFITSAGLPVSLCTNYVAGNPPAFAAPVVTLFDPATAAVTATLPLTKGGLLGGVYGYLDDRDRVVVADGSGAILRVAHRATRTGWELYVDERIDISGQLGGDAVTGLSPDHLGRIWWITTRGIVGTVTPRSGNRVAAARLPRGEELGNGLSVRPGGVSVLTTHALYEMWAGDDGVPRTVWRNAYDRGPGRKPGQLTWGSGTTPSYFGDGWVAIVDNARVPHLHVYRSDDGTTVCSIRAFAAAEQGTENSPMTWGNSIVIPSTYGFEYPPMAVSGPAVPASAPFRGGLTRIDVEGGRCVRKWETTDDRLATLPRLSTADGLIYALAYGPSSPAPSSSAPWTSRRSTSRRGAAWPPGRSAPPPWTSRCSSPE